VNGPGPHASAFPAAQRAGAAQEIARQRNNFILSPASAGHFFGTGHSPSHHRAITGPSLLRRALKTNGPVHASNVIHNSSIDLPRDPSARTTRYLTSIGYGDERTRWRGLSRAAPQRSQPQAWLGRHAGAGAPA